MQECFLIVTCAIIVDAMADEIVWEQTIVDWHMRLLLLFGTLHRRCFACYRTCSVAQFGNGFF